MNIHALPVVQVDDTADYGPKRQIMLNNLKIKTKELFNIPGSLYGIAPEGTRNQVDGKLQKANRGIGYLEKYAPDTFYLPVSVIYKQFSINPEVKVGVPLQLKDIIPSETELPTDPNDRAQIIADYHMYRLSSLMPVELQGAYQFD